MITESELLSMRRVLMHDNPNDPMLLSDAQKLAHALSRIADADPANDPEYLAFVAEQESELLMISRGIRKARQVAERAARKCRDPFAVVDNCDTAGKDRYDVVPLDWIDHTDAVVCVSHYETTFYDHVYLKGTRCDY